MKVKNIWKIIKSSSNLYLYSTLGVILAIIFLILLNYFQFYVHELGHANSAVLYTFTQKNPNLTMNFTYIDFLGKEYLKVPQQTIAPIPNIMSVYGVLFTLVFYIFIFLLIARLKIVRNNKWLEYPLAISLFLLVLQDIVFNLFCGTDGFKLSCNAFILKFLSWSFNGTLLLSLGFFFVMLIMFIKNKKFNKSEI